MVRSCNNCRNLCRDRKYSTTGPIRLLFSGPLRITKGDDVSAFLNADDIPTNIKGVLNDAALHNSCGELRHVAQEVTDILGSNISE